MSAPANAWDQLPGEPPEAYARFLIYRNLGPARTIDAAYGASAGNRRKSQSTSGQWLADSSAYNWRERAARWDVAQLSVVVPETTGLIFEAIAEYSKIVLEELKARKRKPGSWIELKEYLVVLSNLVSPDVIAAAADHARAAGPEPAPGAGASPDTGGPGASGGTPGSDADA